MDTKKLTEDLWEIIACIYCDNRTDALGIIHEILEKIEMEPI